MDNPISSDLDQLTCLIIAGGRGSRMSGEDKGLMDWRGYPIIQHLLDCFSGSFSNIIINANRHHNVYQSYGYPIVTDQISGYAGPLAGIHAGLSVVVTPYVFVTPCDLPFMQTEVAAQLYCKLRDSQAELAVVELGGRIEPLTMVLKTTLIDSLADYLQSNQRRASQWVQQQNHIKVPMGDMENCFTNINTIDDIEKYA